MDNKDIDRAFKREALKERKEKYRKPLIMFGLIAIGLIIMFFISPKQIEHDSEIVMGKTISVITASEWYGYDTAMMVLLDNGKNARVPMKKGIVFVEGKAVEIKIITSKDTVTYEFIRYKED